MRSGLASFEPQARRGRHPDSVTVVAVGITRWAPYVNAHAPALCPCAVCRAVREAVGEDMVLMLDPYGVYTLEEALWVGHQLEDLGYYWLEHPMIETRMEPYRRLARELSINICSPEHVRGGMYSRAEWILQGASDLLRIDPGYGGLTACWKTAAVCQAFGLKCELHGGGWRWANTQLLGATTEATSEYYERGLLLPGIDGNDTPPYLEAIADPMDAAGNVIIPEAPGLGMQLNWDYGSTME